MKKNSRTERIEKITGDFQARDLTRVKDFNYMSQYREVGAILSDIHQTQEALERKIKPVNSLGSVYEQVIQKLAQYFGKSIEPIDPLVVIDRQHENICGLQKNLQIVINASTNESALLEQRVDREYEWFEQNRRRVLQLKEKEEQIDQEHEEKIQPSELTINDPEYFVELRHKDKTLRTLYKTIKSVDQKEKEFQTRYTRFKFLKGHQLFHEALLDSAEDLYRKTNDMVENIRQTKHLYVTQQPLSSIMGYICEGLDLLSGNTHSMKSIYEDSAKKMAKVTELDIEPHESADTVNYLASESLKTKHLPKN